MTPTCRRCAPVIPVVVCVIAASACAQEQPPPVDESTRATEPVMTRAEFRQRVGVCSVTADLLPVAARKLPIGFYRDYTALGSAHRDADWAAGLRAPYLPIIQYRSLGDTPAILAALRSAAESGVFPMPEGASVDEAMTMLGLADLEPWLVARTKDGTFPRGTLFLLGNEPGYRPNNDPRTPEQLVEDARVVREVFERNDLGHRLGLGGLSAPDNAQARRAFGMAPMDFFEAILEEAARQHVTFDAFAIHPYPATGFQTLDDYRNLPEVAVLIQDSIDLVRAFRALMREHGHRDKDLIVAEIGLPFETDDETISSYAADFLAWCLTATDDALGNADDDGRLVQRFTWLMLAVPEEPTPGITDHPVFEFDRSTLMDHEGALTELGRTFNAVADRLAPRDESD